MKSATISNFPWLECKKLAPFQSPLLLLAEKLGLQRGPSELGHYVQTPTKELHFIDEETKAQKYEMT